ncbi:MAG: hypothetical protein ACR2NA_14240 [Solirubrobacterales bacterium]
MGPLELLILLLFVGLPGYLIFWTVRRTRNRPCPRCNRLVRNGQVACHHCGHEFAATP